MVKDPLWSDSLLSTDRMKLYSRELIYSGVARHLEHNLLRQTPAFLSIFGTDAIRLGFHFCTNLSKIESLFLCDGAQELIERHTMFPLYRQFRSDSEIAKFTRELTFYRNRIRFVQHEHLSPFRFLYCPECVAEDISSLGETYWHVDHCIPYVTICTQHNCLLELGEPPIQYLRTSRINSANNIRPSIARYNKNQDLFSLAQSVVSQLDHPASQREELVVLAQASGFMKSNQRISIQPERFEDLLKYAKSLTPQIYELMRNKRSEIPKLLVGKWHGTFTIVCNLIWLFLKHHSQPAKPPQIPVTKCINPFCLHFETDTKIKTSQFKYYRIPGAKRLRASCSGCGMIYTKYISLPGPPIILTYGFIVKTEIVKHLKAGLPMAALKTRIGISRNAIRNIANGIEFQWRRPNLNKWKMLLEERRSIWENELRSADFVSLANSRKKRSVEYRWLLKNDNKRTKQLNFKYQTKRTRWSRQIDLVALDKVGIRAIETAHKTLLRVKLTKRITPTLICALVPTEIRRNIKNLRSSSLALVEKFESTLDWKLRIIQNYIEGQQGTLKISKTFLFRTFNLSQIEKHELELIYARFLTS